ncbi:MAG: Ig-like domain-containing protein, partial [Chloroflexota bacterium]
LNQAKLAYISQVPSIRGTHEKSLLVTTVFGLPMLSFDLPGRANPPGDSSVVAGLTPFSTPPGAVTGLEYFDLTVNSPLNVNPVELTDVDTKQVLDAEFLSGNDGEVTYPTEPFLPLEIENVTAPGTTLRGVGFRGGNYEDVFNILPVTGAPTTEAIALHLSWQTPYLHPPRMDNSNYLGALIDGQQRILFTPAQHIQGDTVNVGGATVRLSHRRQFSQMQYRLFYNNDSTEFCEDPANPTPETCHTPAFSAGPAIVRVSAIPGDDDITFRMMVVGDPAAGIQGVWVTWTTALDAPGTGVWQSIDLAQRESDTRIWEGTLPLNGLAPADIRYMVQAVNGFGLVSQDVNRGNFFTPGLDSEPTIETVLTLEAPDNGLFDTLVDVSAVLKTGGGQPLQGQTVEFRLGSTLSAVGTTDAGGRARASLNLVGLPGAYKLYASFAGNAPYKSASAVKNFEILKQQARIEGLSDAVVFAGQDSGIVITLVDQQGESLRERGLFAVITQPPDNTPLFAVAGITDLFGRVALGTLPLDLTTGLYQLTAYFNDPSNPLAQTLTSDGYTSARASAQLTLLPSPCDSLNNPDAIIPLLTDPNDPNNHPPSIWPPNGEFWRVDLLENDPDIPDGFLSLTITGIFQDETVGNDGPDGQFISAEDTDSVLLRAQRDGSGDGRVYHLQYTVSNGPGFSCDGVELIAVVPHDQSGDPAAFDSSPPLYDSTAGPKNDPPVAVDDAAVTNEDTPVVIDVLANDTDPDNTDTLSVIQLGNPAHGTAAVNPDSTITYTPGQDFYGSDSFTYQAGDGALTSNVATVTLTINPVNDPPLANDDAGATGPDTPTIIDVLANDSDVDSAIDPASVVVVSAPANGTAISNGDGAITYTPNSGFINAVDTFVYQVCDNEGACSTATVDVTVSGNSPPVARDDLATTDEDVAVSIDVLADNGHGPDADAEDGSPNPATVNIEAGPANGTIVVDASGIVTYTPPGNFFGVDSFSYTVKDSGGLTSNAAVVTIAVNAVPDAPVANDDQATTGEGVPVVIDVLANDTDVDSAIDPATVSIVSQPAHGTASVDAGTGEVTYTPNANFNGADSFTYTVEDDTGLISNVATVAMSVTGQNDPPDAVDDNVTTPKGTPVVIPVLANDTDPDGDTLTVTQFTQGNRGTVTANADGTLTYTPNSSYKGDDSFTYTISDGKGGADTATVHITTTN